MNAMEFLMSETFWIGFSVILLLSVIGICILIYLIFKRTHLAEELKAHVSKTPIAIFFQDNKFAEWKAITPINGVIYDKKYGPFIVSNTYVDKKTKNIIIPFDVDMDGDRTSDIKELVKQFRNITNNEKSIAMLRQLISTQQIEQTKNVKNITSIIKYSALKSLFNSTSPHNIKSKIEKIVSERIQKYGNVNHMHAVVTFGAIFGLIVISAILMKTMGII